MAEKLFLNANMVCKADSFNLEKVAVEKVINVSDAEFKRFVEKPLERNYYLSTYKELSGFYDDSYHGVLFVNTESGDGLLVNSEGADYARYSQYIPNARALVQEHEQTESLKEFNKHLKSWVWGCASDGAGRQEFEVSFDEFLNAPDTCEVLSDCFRAALCARPEIKSVIETNNKIIAERNDLTEIRLYCPLTLRVEPDDPCDDLDEVDSANYIDYDEEINDKILADIREDENAVKCGLAAYLYDESIAEKVYSIFPEVETRNGELYGVAVCKSYGELDHAEMTELMEYITGQFSDGWGESYEQHPVTLGGDEVYISFWDCDDDYFLKPESEVFPTQNFEQTMGGMMLYNKT